MGHKYKPKPTSIMIAMWKKDRWEVITSPPNYKPGDKIQYRHQGVVYIGEVLEVQLANCIPGVCKLDFFQTSYSVQPVTIVHRHWVTEEQIID